MEKIDLSLVLPCYNEEPILEENVKRIMRLLDATKYSYELILIDDKSSDNTAKIAETIAFRNPEKIRAFFHGKNSGRGAVVREGIIAARGRIAGYIDVDLEVPEENILTHALAIDDGFDVAYANRITRMTITNFHRQVMHSAYVLLERILLGTIFNDTNAGCKFFNRKKILPVLAKTKDNHWFFDTEILARSREAGLKMKEIPALYITNRKSRSTVKVFEDTIYFIRKLFEFSKEMKKEKQGNQRQVLK